MPKYLNATANHAKFRMIKYFPPAKTWLVVFMGCAMGVRLCAQDFVLHLKSGDQIRGAIVEESTNQVVISNAWVKALSVPLSEIADRQALAGAAGATNKIGDTMKSLEAASAKAGLAASARPSVAKPAPPTAKLHGQINVGLDALYATKTQQDYFGKINITYEHAYPSNPKKFFRNTSQGSGEYKRTDDQISANRAKGSNKSDFDLGEASYGYGSFGGGFDRVRKIDEQYQVGSGLGRHMVRSDSFILNAETGFNYETEYRSDTSNLDSVYMRLAEDFTWKILKNLTLTKKMEFLSNLEKTSEYQAGLTSNLSYGFWENLTLNLTAEDNYTTEVAPEVQRNEFELRLTLGAMF